MQKVDARVSGDVGMNRSRARAKGLKGEGTRIQKTPRRSDQLTATSLAAKSLGLTFLCFFSLSSAFFLSAALVGRPGLASCPHRASA